MAEIIQLKNRSTGEDQHPKTTTDAVSHNNSSLSSVLNAKQAKLIEGDNITLTPKADGTVEISASGGSSTPVVDNLNSTSTTSALSANQGRVLDSKFANKQNNLVSGTNIKTINGQSILGNGDIVIEGGGSATPVIDSLTSTSKTSALSANQGKVLDGKITSLSSEAVVKVVPQSSADVTLANNTQFNYATSPTEINISLPAGWAEEDLSLITFTTGETATQVSFPSGINVKGSIEANKSVEMNIYNNNAIILNV